MSEMCRLCPINAPLPAVACYRKVLHLWFISAFFGSSLHFFPEKRAGNFLSWVRQKSSQSLTSNVAGKKDSSQLSVFRKGSFQLWAISFQLSVLSFWCYSRYPLSGSQHKAVEASLTSNYGEFAIIKLGILNTLPDAEKLNSITVSHPILDDMIWAAGFLVFGNIGQG